MNDQGAYSPQMAVRAEILKNLMSTAVWLRIATAGVYLSVALVVWILFKLSWALETMGTEADTRSLRNRMMGILIIQLGALIVAAVMMTRYANAIRLLQRGRRVADFELAVERQRAMWITFGVFLLIQMALAAFLHFYDPTGGAGS